MAKKATAPGAGKQTKVPRHFEFSRIFKSPRMLGYAIIWGLFFMIDAALLGLTSQQIHRHGGQNTFDWPAAEYGHVMGLMLFTAVFGLLVSLFHWYFSVGTYIFLFLVLGVFNGVGGGVFQATPFGRSLRCGNPVDTFPENYQPYVESDCSRVTAITGLAWALFGLSVIGMFYSFFDRFKLGTRNTKTYDIETGPTEEEKAALARKTSEQSHHTSA